MNQSMQERLALRHQRREERRLRELQEANDRHNKDHSSEFFDPFGTGAMTSDRMGGSSGRETMQKATSLGYVFSDNDEMEQGDNEPMTGVPSRASFAALAPVTPRSSSTRNCAMDASNMAHTTIASTRCGGVPREGSVPMLLKPPSKDTRAYNNNNQGLMPRSSKDTQILNGITKNAEARTRIESNQRKLSDRNLGIDLSIRGREPQRGDLQRTRSRSLSDLRPTRPRSEKVVRQIRRPSMKRNITMDDGGSSHHMSSRRMPPKRGSKSKQMPPKEPSKQRSSSRAIAAREELEGNSEVPIEAFASSSNNNIKKKASRSIKSTKSNESSSECTATTTTSASTPPPPAPPPPPTPKKQRTPKTPRSLKRGVSQPQNPHNPENDSSSRQLQPKESKKSLHKSNSHSPSEPCRLQKAANQTTMTPSSGKRRKSARNSSRGKRSSTDRFRLASYNDNKMTLSQSNKSNGGTKDLQFEPSDSEESMDDDDAWFTTPHRTPKAKKLSMQFPPGSDEEDDDDNDPMRRMMNIKFHHSFANDGSDGDIFGDSQQTMRRGVSNRELMTDESMTSVGSLSQSMQFSRGHQSMSHLEFEASASGWSMANPEQVHKWKQKMSAPSTTCKNQDVKPQAEPPAAALKTPDSDTSARIYSNRRRNSYTGSTFDRLPHKQAHVILVSDNFRPDNPASLSQEGPAAEDDAPPTLMDVTREDLNFSAKSVNETDRPSSRSRSISVVGLSSDKGANQSPEAFHKTILMDETKKKSVTVKKEGSEEERMGRSISRGVLPRTRSRSLSDIKHACRKSIESKEIRKTDNFTKRRRSLKYSETDDNVSSENKGDKSGQRKSPNQKTSTKSIARSKTMAIPTSMMKTKSMRRVQSLHEDKLSTKKSSSARKLTEKAPNESQAKENQLTGSQGNEQENVESSQATKTSKQQTPLSKRSVTSRRGVARTRSRSLSDLRRAPRGGRKSLGTAQVTRGQDFHVRDEKRANGSLMTPKSIDGERRPSSKTTSTRGVEKRARKVRLSRSRTESASKKPAAEKERSNNPRRAATESVTDRPTLGRKKSNSLTNLRSHVQKRRQVATKKTSRNAFSDLNTSKEEQDIAMLKKQIESLTLQLDSAQIPEENEATTDTVAGDEECASSETIIKYLTEENENESTEQKILKEKMFDLHQDNMKLEEAIVKTEDYYAELEAIHNAEVMKNEALSENVPVFQKVIEAHELKLARRTRYVEFERQTTLFYEGRIRSIVRTVRAKCNDEELLRELEEMTP